MTWIVKSEGTGTCTLMAAKGPIRAGAHMLAVDPMVTEEEADAHPILKVLGRKVSCLMFSEKEYMSIMTERDGLIEYPIGLLPCLFYNKPDGVWMAEFRYKLDDEDTSLVKGATPVEAAQAYVKESGFTGELPYSIKVLDALKENSFAILPASKVNAFRIVNSDSQLGQGKTPAEAVNAAIMTSNAMLEGIVLDVDQNGNVDCHHPKNGPRYPSVN